MVAEKLKKRTLLVCIVCYLHKENKYYNTIHYKTFLKDLSLLYLILWGVSVYEHVYTYDYHTGGRIIIIYPVCVLGTDSCP